jgi:hypothetical protein
MINSGLISLPNRLAPSVCDCIWLYSHGVGQFDVRQALSLSSSGDKLEVCRTLEFNLTHYLFPWTIRQSVRSPTARESKCNRGLEIGSEPLLTRRLLTRTGGRFHVNVSGRFLLELNCRRCYCMRPFIIRSTLDYGRGNATAARGI